MPSDEANVFLKQLSTIRCNALKYFEHIIDQVDLKYFDFDADAYWNQLQTEFKLKAEGVIQQLLGLAPEIAPAIRRSPLLAEEDEHDAGHALKSMRAALRLREYQYSGTEVLHDEGTFLGVRHATQYENRPLNPAEAKIEFSNSADRLQAVLELIGMAPGDSQLSFAVKGAPITAGYRPGTAFIMMWISPQQPELIDVCDTIKRCFAKFGINAVRADDIEHEDVITKRILDEIKTAEFLFADLTGERPSVYYEVGYAHALGRRVMLYRKSGTAIHFDLAAYNCPEYENMRKLEELLTKRIATITGQNPAEES